MQVRILFPVPFLIAEKQGVGSAATATVSKTVYHRGFESLTPCHLEHKDKIMSRKQELISWVNKERSNGLCGICFSTNSRLSSERFDLISKAIKDDESLGFIEEDEADEIMNVIQAPSLKDSEIF